MALTKKQRQIVHDKYGGRCAYCGCELPKRWHADHIEPVQRRRVWDKRQAKWLPAGVEHPDREKVDNYNPSCPSCNIIKSSHKLEFFREIIGNFINSLNEYSVQYKFAKKYGLVEETGKEVKFYFETLED